MCQTPSSSWTSSWPRGSSSPRSSRRSRRRGKYLLGAVGRVEKATGLRYPPYYVEPTLPLAVTSLEYGSVGAFFARVIPTAFEGKALDNRPVHGPATPLRDEGHD